MVVKVLPQYLAFGKSSVEHKIARGMSFFEFKRRAGFLFEIGFALDEDLG